MKTATMKTKKVFSILMAAALILGLFPAGPFAPLTARADDAGQLVTYINNPLSHGGSGSLTATASGNTVTVTGGPVTGAGTTLTLDIDSDVTVIWQADYEGTANPLIELTGGGTFQVESGTISATGAGGDALHNNGSGTVVISGGTVEATGNNGIAINNSGSSTVEMTGGTVKATGNAFTALSITGGTIAIYGGTVQAGPQTDYIISNSGGVVAYLSGTLSGNVSLSLSNDSIVAEVLTLSIPAAYHNTSKDLNISSSRGDAVATWDTTGNTPKITFFIANSSAEYTIPWGVLLPTANDSPTFTTRTLTDALTGVSVTGSMDPYARLRVTQNWLHPANTCKACDEIRTMDTLGIYDVSITGYRSGPYRVFIPFAGEGGVYTMLHCHNGTLERQTAPYANGGITAEFRSISPFAVVRSPTMTVPENIVADPPKTGEAPSVWGYVLLAAALVGLWHRKRAW